MIQATGAAFNTNDIFMNFPLKKLKISCKECEKVIGNPHRNFLVHKIFRENMKMILNDIIDNNVTFELPTGARKCDIHMEKINGDRFRDLRRNGKWLDVDMLTSNFTGYRLALYMYGLRGPRIKPIYVNKEMSLKIIDNINKGKQYC